MGRLTWQWILRVLAMAAVVSLAAPAHAAPDQSDRDPEATTTATPETEGPPPIYLFLNSPKELDSFWKMMEKPDFVLMKGDELRKRLERARSAPAPSGAVVTGVSIEGEAEGDFADLTIEYAIRLGTSEPTWVAIRLDHQTVTEARAADHDLPLRVVAGAGWQVELRGAGAHRVRVRLKVPLKTTAEGRRLEFIIPEAATTQFRLDVPQRVAEASINGSGPVDLAPIQEASRTRLSAHLAPSSRFELSWRVKAEPGAQLAPLLSIQGEIAIDIDPGSFRTWSSWLISAVRGSTRNLEFRIDPDDEVLELKLDDQPVPAGIERVARATVMTIPLDEPLRLGPPRRLFMTTRRTIAARSSERLTFNGFPLTSAKEQSGAIGIAQSGNLWISGTAGHGLRRIDPRTELPTDLRVRPDTVLAYRFVDQPFELGLQVDPSPPLVRCEARTTIGLDPRQARVETQLDFQAAHGRLYDLTIGIPRGLELESVGPREVVAMSSETRDGMTAATSDDPRVLTVRLTPKAQEASAFSLHLIGRQAIDPDRPVAVALFQPRETAMKGGRLAVVTDRNLTVDLADREGVGDPEVFRPALQDPPVDWPWPAGRVRDGPPALWLRYDQNPVSVPLRVTVHPRAVTHATTLLVQVGLGAVEIRQETACAVHFGTLDHLDVEVPAALQERWGLEGGDVTAQEDLGTTPRGARRYRLKFASSVTDKVQLTFRLRHRLTAPLDPDHPTEIEVPWLRIAEGTAAPMHVQVAADPAILLEERETTWSRTDGDEHATRGEDGPPVRFTLVGPEAETTPPKLVATARAMADLPPLVAPRLWLRTVQEPEGDLRTTAWYGLETHASSLSVALPPGAEWVRAKVDGESLARVESLPRSSGYRLHLPPRPASGPVRVELEYLIPRRFATPPWSPPRLLHGGLVQQTLWEVRIPWNRAVVGVPAGWTDENQWYWDRYVWKRRPWKSTAALAAWVQGNSGTARSTTARDADGRGDEHSYLFGRPGQPATLPLWIASRAWLVAVCSGSVLGLGVLLLFWRPPVRLVLAALLALVLAVATAVQPSVTLLAVQSAMVGVAFTLLAVLMHRLVERRHRAASPLFGEPNGLASPPPGSTVSRSIGVGSDDPTEIRARPASSTAEHIVASPMPTPEISAQHGPPPDRR